MLKFLHFALMLPLFNFTEYKFTRLHIVFINIVFRFKLSEHLEQSKKEPVISSFVLRQKLSPKNIKCVLIAGQHVEQQYETKFIKGNEYICRGDKYIKTDFPCLCLQGVYFKRKEFAPIGSRPFMKGVCMQQSQKCSSLYNNGNITKCVSST